MSEIPLYLAHTELPPPQNHRGALGVCLQEYLARVKMRPPS